MNARHTGSRPLGTGASRLHAARRFPAADRSWRQRRVSKRRRCCRARRWREADHTEPAFCGRKAAGEEAAESAADADPGARGVRFDGAAEATGNCGPGAKNICGTRKAVPPPIPRTFHGSKAWEWVAAPTERQVECNSAGAAECRKMRIRTNG